MAVPYTMRAMMARMVETMVNQLGKRRIAGSLPPVFAIFWVGDKGLGFKVMRSGQSGKVILSWIDEATDP